MRIVPLLLLLAPAALAAEPKGRILEYKSGDTVCEGYLVEHGDDAKRPGVLVVHDIGGPREWFHDIARKVAAQGYVALAVDVYGKGVRPKTRDEKRAAGARYRNDIPLFRKRMADGLRTLLGTGKVDPKRVAAIGYCFGGQAVLELARSGADVKGVVSLHGSLLATQPAKEGEVKARVLVLHGALDPNASSTIETCVTLSKELEAAKVDYEIILYAGAVHAFTKPGERYNEKADQRSWRAMEGFLAEVLGEDGPAREVYDVVLKDVGPGKIQVIKAVRSLTGLGLKEAKDLVDRVGDGGVIVLDDAELDRVKQAVTMLQDAGAKVEVQPQPK